MRIGEFGRGISAPTALAVRTAGASGSTWYTRRGVETPRNWSMVKSGCSPLCFTVGGKLHYRCLSKPPLSQWGALSWTKLANQLA